MKPIIAALVLGLCLSPAQAQQTDGFLCTPYLDGEPAPGTIYCFYWNNASIRWEEWGNVNSQGEAKTFYEDISSLVPADLSIPYEQKYTFCAWDGVYRSEWTEPVEYRENVYRDYELVMDILWPGAIDPNDPE